MVHGRNCDRFTAATNGHIASNEKRIQDTIGILHATSFDELVVQDITKLLQSHDEELSNKELLQMEHVT